jgi:ABC-type amino acid transport substrate-binding protein
MISIWVSADTLEKDMMRAPWPIAATLFSLICACAPAHAGDLQLDPSSAQPAVKICLNENLPPFSTRKGHTGFDIALADALGESLKRPIIIRWFESELDDDKSPALEANALLSDGLCDLVGNFPLTEDSLEQPHVLTSRLPDYDGAKPEDRRRRVALGALIATQPVRRTTLSVILGPGAQTKPIHGLADLAGLRIGSESGTLGDMILMQFEHGHLVNDITHVVPVRGELLERLDKGEFDAVLVDLGRFDAYRAKHPEARLSASGFYHRVGFNMGFVSLSTQAALKDRLNQVLKDLETSGKLEHLAQAAGVTYLPPSEPAVSPHMLIRDLLN